MKLAQASPQRVTVHGRDAVMVVDAEMFAALLHSSQQPSLHHLLSESPLVLLKSGGKTVRAPGWDVVQ